VRRFQSGVLNDGKPAIVVEVVGELDLTFGPSHSAMQAGPIVGEASSRVDGANGAMNVQMIRVAMDNRAGPGKLD